MVLEGHLRGRKKKKEKLHLKVEMEEASALLKVLYKAIAKFGGYDTKIFALH